jgi:glutaryl-CoA dehydrogenase (non-decarboxylating)
MRLELTPEQAGCRAAFRAFADKELCPRAAGFEAEERVPDALVEEMGRRGYLGAMIPERHGGSGLSMVTCGLLHEEIGRGCSSTRSLLTVHHMVSHAILRWGSDAQRRAWLPSLASGDRIGAFCLTEENVGSDAKSVETTAVPVDGGYEITGRKKWITFGQRADLFLVFAREGDRPSAFLVERNTEGLACRPVTGMLGMRAAMLADVELDGCRVPARNLLGPSGRGTSHVAASALEVGRYTVAWGCVGIGQACLEESVRHASTRQQFGVPLERHQLVQRRLSDMMVRVRSARLLAYQAGYSKDRGHPNSALESFMAKYAAADMASRVASAAVQIQGARGCQQSSSVERAFRDARLMEIIEGTTEIQQMTIARYARRELIPESRLC